MDRSPSPALLELVVWLAEDLRYLSDARLAIAIDDLIALLGLARAGSAALAVGATHELDGAFDLAFAGDHYPGAVPA